MAEIYENNNPQEQIWKKFDDLDKNINDLDSKVQEREDFTKYVQELQNIQNKFTKLDNDIQNLTDENIRKALESHLSNLKIMMLDLISDWNIDNFVNWETKDIAINKMVWQVDEIFYGEMENLIKSLNFWDWKLSDALSDSDHITESGLIDIVQFLWLPYWEISVDWQQYLWFVLPQTWEIYALVDWKLRMCEWVLGRQEWWDVSKSSSSQQKKQWKFEISTSEKLTKASIDNPLQKKETVKGSYNVWNWISWFASIETQWVWATPRIWASWKWLKSNVWNVWLNTQLTASYSPWVFTWAENGWRKDKEVYKWKIQQNFKLKNGINFSISEIFKTSDFSKIKSSNFTTELRASWKPKSNMSFSAIANFDHTGNPTFMWIWGKINI